MTAPSFSARDLVRLERALRVLLHPTAESPVGWLLDVSEVMRELVDGAAGIIGIPGECGGPRLFSAQVGHDVLKPYEEHYWRHDFLTARVIGTPTSVAGLHDVTSIAEVDASVLHNEYTKPHGMWEPYLIQTAPGPDASARMWLVYPRFQTEEEFVAHGALLRAVAPAFVAGATAWLRLAAGQQGLAQVLETMTGAAAVCDLEGALVHGNARMGELLAGPAGATLRAALESAARSLARLAPGTAPRLGAPVDAARAASREVATPHGRFRLRATFAAEGVLGNAPHVVVAVEPVRAGPLTDADLQARFGLTDREIEIARLMADGLGNKEIAARLGVSFFTARNHAERVMGKLGADGRGRVGPILGGR
ncbi:MAG: response regulator transcription factor [Gemmatimonadaceae bacterium]